MKTFLYDLIGFMNDRTTLTAKEFQHYIDSTSVILFYIDSTNEVLENWI